MADAHEPYYRADLALVHHLGFGFHAARCAPGILALLEPVRKRGGLVVELGCGSGLLTRYLVDAGHRVIATDASPAMLDLARGCAGILGTREVAEDDVDVRDARGPGYGLPSPEGIAAARLAAETEGLLLDPVFTAKAFAVLVSMVQGGLDAPAVFVHTGGVASVLSEGGLWDA